MTKKGLQREIDKAIDELIKACEDGNIKVLEGLFETGRLYVHQVNKKGLIPLFVAVDHGHLSVAKYLLNHGEDVSYSTSPPR